MYIPQFRLTILTTLLISALSAQTYPTPKPVTVTIGKAPEYKLTLHLRCGSRTIVVDEYGRAEGNPKSEPSSGTTVKYNDVPNISKPAYKRLDLYETRIDPYSSGSPKERLALQYDPQMLKVKRVYFKASGKPTRVFDIRYSPVRLWPEYFLLNKEKAQLIYMPIGDKPVISGTKPESFSLTIN